MITKNDAIHSLVANAKYVAKDGFIFLWESPDIPQPTDAEIEAEVNRLIAEQPAKEARAERDRRLSNTDWVVTKYKEMSKAVPTAWKTYRQALRDLPEQSEFPTNIEWPQEPETT